ncbi:MAG: type II secretion system protein GspE, partial [Azovibrio sp.]|nr:type II secretion system protein GspE [Azovibrio sp.]
LAALNGVLAQRLVRRLCPHCKEAVRPDPAELERLAPHQPQWLYRPVGCPRCAQTGYQGRSGIYELLEVDDSLRRLIHDRAPEALLRQAAAAPEHPAPLRLLREDGLRWVLQGETALEELLRVTRD